mgnify:FL=1
MNTVAAFHLASVFTGGTLIAVGLEMPRAATILAFMAGVNAINWAWCRSVLPAWVGFTSIIALTVAMISVLTSMAA